MRCTITIGDKQIIVLLHKQRVGIVNDAALQALLSHQPEQHTDTLAEAIKNEYVRLFNQEFDVSANSLVVEIWGHLFADKFAVAVKNLSPFAAVDALSEKVSARCSIINVGEKSNDNNRLFWDLLAPLKPAIAAFI